MKKVEDLNPALKKLQTELKLRGFSAQTSRMYLFYNNKFIEYIKDVRTDEIKSIVLGLFALIGLAIECIFERYNITFLTYQVSIRSTTC